MRDCLGTVPIHYVMNVPVFQKQTRSQMHLDPPHAAIPLIHSQFPEELSRFFFFFYTAVLCSNNETHCSTSRSVSKQRTVLIALSPHMQVTNLPIMHVNPSHGPSRPIKRPRFYRSEISQKHRISLLGKVKTWIIPQMQVSRWPPSSKHAFEVTGTQAPEVLQSSKV